jgi:hypothetical protein
MFINYQLGGRPFTFCTFAFNLIMKFQVGDKVLILHSNEEGEVVDIINNKMVMVDVRGVKFPAYIDQLDFPYFKKFSEKKMFPKKENKQYVDSLKKEKAAPQKVAAMGCGFPFFRNFRPTSLAMMWWIFENPYP